MYSRCKRCSKLLNHTTNVSKSSLKWNDNFAKTIHSVPFTRTSPKTSDLSSWRRKSVASSNTVATNLDKAVCNDLVKSPKSATATLSNPKLSKLIKSNFPKSRLCFAYGSNILHQTDNLPGPTTMTDVIFVVENPYTWHSQNFGKNKHHYSPIMRLLGPSFVSVLQSSMGAYCYFNPYAEVDGVLLKYGVISEHHFLSDLEKWETLYVAGRLHKPVLLIDKDPSFKVSSLIKLNIRSALHTALILLPDRFNDLQLFSVISKISYFGDIRFYVPFVKAENPDKVRNIVTPNIPYFQELYKNVISESPFIERTDYGYIQANKRDKTLYELEKFLPRLVLYLPEGNVNPKSRVFRFDKNEDPKDQLFRKTAAGDIRYIEEQLRKIVMLPSAMQAFKGFITAGPFKSLKYSLSKLKKAKSTGKGELAVRDVKEKVKSAEVQDVGRDSYGPIVGICCLVLVGNLILAFREKDKVAE